MPGCRVLGTYFNNWQPGVGKEVFGKEHICFANVRSYLVIRLSGPQGSLFEHRVSHFCQRL